jgi:hypothetical protein
MASYIGTMVSMASVAFMTPDGVLGVSGTSRVLITLLLLRRPEA